ncbi:MAG TPA: universal stress protein [Gaiellaceae bacterium]
MTRGTLDRPAPPAASPVARDVRPVMLLTLNVELEEQAIAFAIDSAAEAGAELYICDAIPLEYRNYVGHAAHQFAEQLIRKHLNAVARRARDRGVTTSQLAFHNRRPVKTALEVARDERIGLLVFGADRKELGKRAFRKAVKRIRENPPCLVWVGAD